MPLPEQVARATIDQLLIEAGWIVQNREQINLRAGRGVAVREFALRTDYADYLLFFDRKPASPTPWTEQLWIYDLRTNMNFTLKENPLMRSDLDEFVACFNPDNRHERTASWTSDTAEGRWRAYTYDELLARDKVNLDIFWLRDETLEESSNLPAQEVLAVEIMEDLQAALEQFRAIVEDLEEEPA